MNLKAEVLKVFESLSFSEWDAKIRYRGLDHKRDKALVAIEKMYLEKIPRLERMLLTIDLKQPTTQAITQATISKAVLKVEAVGIKQQFMPLPEGYEKSLLRQNYGEVLDRITELGEIIELPNDKTGLQEKIERIKEKFACSLKEQEFRLDKLVTRSYHDTIYYIDLDGGDDANDGLTTGNAWLTLEKYTTTTVRSAGDIAYVRANTSEVASADILLDEDGTIDSAISVIGCDSVTNDPWGDSSDVLPTIGWGDGNFQLFINGDNFWYWELIEFNSSSYVNGTVRARQSHTHTFKDCITQGNSTQRGVYLEEAANFLFDGWVSYDNTTYGAYLNVSSARFKDCASYGGAVNGQDYGLFVRYSAAELENSTFGVVNSDLHDVASIRVQPRVGTVHMINCKLDDAVEVVSAFATLPNSLVWSEDHDQVAGASKAFFWNGTVERDSGVQLDSLDSAKLSPTQYCGVLTPMRAGGELPLFNGDYQIWVAAAATTIAIKARETAAWATDPSSSEFRLAVSYLDGVSGRSRTIGYSNNSLSGTTEVSFDVAFTPNAAGWVYVWWKLAKFESGKFVNVSVKPAIT